MLTEYDGWRLRRAGFTHREIDTYAGAVTSTGADQPPILLDSPVWQKVMRRRRRIAKRLQGRYEEDTGQELSRMRLDRFIDAQGIDPWEWVKLEYKHGMKRVADFSEAMKRARRDALVETTPLRGRGR